MPTLGVDAIRLGAVEALCPTAAIIADSGYPTLAGKHVYDSRSVPIEHLQPGAKAVPVIAVYTEMVRGAPRGPAQFSVPADFTVDLVIELELAVRVRAGGGEPEGVGTPTTDAGGELQLGFLVAQARRAIVAAVGSGVLHRIVKQIVDVEAVPLRDFVSGERLVRRSLRLRCAFDDDRWNPAGGLPEPLAMLRARLPDGSAAAARLDRIAAAIAADAARVPLDEIRMTLAAIDGAAAEEPEPPEITVSAAFNDAVPEDEEEEP